MALLFIRLNQFGGVQVYRARLHPAVSSLVFKGLKARRGRHPVRAANWLSVCGQRQFRNKKISVEMQKFCKRSCQFGRPIIVITVELNMNQRSIGAGAESSLCADQNEREEIAMLKASTLKIADTTIIRCHGNILVGEDFTALRSAVTKDCSAKLVVLDMAGVRRIDASGLGFLLGLREWTGKSSAQFKLMNVRPK